MQIIFTMGLPGAGKSTVIEWMELTKTHTLIDPDAIKASHPEYDPKNSDILHEWSWTIAEQKFQEALRAGGNWILGGTGTNIEMMARRMREAKMFGFQVYLIYVKVPLEVALKRNAQRERTLKDYVIVGKALNIETAWDILKNEADVAEIVVN